MRKTTYESTPLHLAAECSYSISVIQELIREFPAALIMRGDVPLAMAFHNFAVDAPNIVRILLDAAPQIATEPDNQGRFNYQRNSWYIHHAGSLSRCCQHRR